MQLAPDPYLIVSCFLNNSSLNSLLGEDILIRISTEDHSWGIRSRTPAGFLAIARTEFGTLELNIPIVSVSVGPESDSLVSEMLSSAIDMHGLVLILPYQGTADIEALTITYCVYLAPESFMNTGSDILGTASTIIRQEIRLLKEMINEFKQELSKPSFSEELFQSENFDKMLKAPKPTKAKDKSKTMELPNVPKDEEEEGEEEEKEED